LKILTVPSEVFSGKESHDEAAEGRIAVTLEKSFPAADFQRRLCFQKISRAGIKEKIDSF
jgi:hypothetical protein